MACGLGVVEVSCGVDLEAHGELVEVFGDLVIIVKGLDEVGFTVAVEIAEADELVAAGDEEIIASIFDAERLEEAGGDAVPLERCGGWSHQAIDAPDIAVPSGDDGRFAVGGKIEAPGTHPALPRIIDGEREGIRDERAVGFSCFGSGGDFCFPATRASFGEGLEVEGSGERFG